jgi:hypothetical protein
MKHLKRLSILMMLLTVISGSRVFAQDYFTSLNPFNQLQMSPRALDVKQDNEYTSTGIEQGIFYENPLMLNGKPLDYNVFNNKLTGELTVIKGAAITGKSIQVSFYCYLRRDGTKVPVPGNEKCKTGYIKVDISEILKHAKEGDLLVIESVNKVDGAVKRILKVLVGGC